jgi:hypothetical protein
VGPEIHKCELWRLVRLLAEGAPSALGAIPWAAPVIVFGSLLKSRVATLGLNPSNLEFEDQEGIQLDEPINRFETLRTLRISDWSRAGRIEIDRIWRSCEYYFKRRPYDGWFKPLDVLINALGVSYYDPIVCGTACHLDLVPFATSEKWSSLNGDVRQRLIRLGTPTLVATLAASDIRVLILNGAGVVRTFEQLLNAPLHAAEVDSWRLRRGDSSGVRGVAYSGIVSTIGGMDLGRKLLVLGYNHNIQSSFGVSTSVVRKIGTWIAENARAAVA